MLHKRVERCPAITNLLKWRNVFKTQRGDRCCIFDFEYANEFSEMKIFVRDTEHLLEEKDEESDCCMMKMNLIDRD